VGFKWIERTTAGKNEWGGVGGSKAKGKNVLFVAMDPSGMKHTPPGLLPPTPPHSFFPSVIP